MREAIGKSECPLYGRGYLSHIEECQECEREAARLASQCKNLTEGGEGKVKNKNKKDKKGKVIATKDRKEEVAVAKKPGRANPFREGSAKYLAYDLLASGLPEEKVAEKLMAEFEKDKKFAIGRIKAAQKALA